jgi:hypothetical protein
MFGKSIQKIGTKLNLFILIALTCTLCLFGEQNSQSAEIQGKPWGAMYTPNRYLTLYGMKGTVKYYRGKRGAKALIRDLSIAERKGIKLIITLGTVRPSEYIDRNGRIDFSKVRKELNPFLSRAAEIQPYIDKGVIWGVRFMDEPHDPAGMPKGVKVNEKDLGKVFKMIKKHFRGVKTGSTAPAWYMVNVPNADFAFGQYNHSNRKVSLTDFFLKEARLAHSKGLLYVASINSNMNSIDNKTFFRDYIKLCRIKEVDFITSWQWPQGNYPYPSFERRINDKNVRNLVKEIPEACGWR